MHIGYCGKARRKEITRWIILNWRLDGMVRTGLIWLRIGTSGGRALVNWWLLKKGSAPDDKRFCFMIPS
jgi:hypothetical protein